MHREAVGLFKQKVVEQYHRYVQLMIFSDWQSAKISDCFFLQSATWTLVLILAVCSSDRKVA